MESSDDTYAVELVSDGDGLAVLGDLAAVERFLASCDLEPRDSEGNAISRSVSAGSGLAAVAATFADSSGRWLKMTPESAAKVKEMGLIPTKTPGISHAMIGQHGRSKSWIKVVESPANALLNPSAMAGLAGVMAQLASQQLLNEVQDYLEQIDEKLDHLIRLQMNQILARIDAVGLALVEAMAVRDGLGRVPDVAWTKIKTHSTTILETQALALRQIADLTKKFDIGDSVGHLAKTSKEVENEISTWLGVLARCVQLNEMQALLELDRVMDTSPEELDRYRLGLNSVRQERIELFERTTIGLLIQMNDAVETANRKVLYNPIQTPQVVQARNYTAAVVRDFHGLLGIDTRVESSEARRWRDAAAVSLTQAQEVASQGLTKAKELGAKSAQGATKTGIRISTTVAERSKRQKPDGTLSDPF
ncbi:MAG: hypothetical protein KDA95_02245 [Acidimicrobiales bacterium]|nr:hypothetical protein [Acidimicrobiales bacterium]